jgi:hypothetical protein
LACVADVSATAAAQSLDDRIAAAPRSVAFDFETRPNVCGDGRSISVNDDRSSGRTTRTGRSGIRIGRTDGRETGTCEFGPAHVIIDHDGRRVSGVRVTVGARAERADTDLGTVPSADAVRYLLGVARHLDSHGADEAITGAAIAAGASPWQTMLDIARDNSASEPARKASLFWVSQEASAAATAGLSDVASDDDATTSVRSDALFFLSQRKAEGVPALIRVVNESKSIRLRKDAIWFLSQSRDPRALDLFEKLLSGR